MFIITKIYFYSVLFNVLRGQMEIVSFDQNYVNFFYRKLLKTEKAFRKIGKKLKDWTNQFFLLKLGIFPLELWMLTHFLLIFDKMSRNELQIISNIWNTSPVKIKIWTKNIVAFFARSAEYTQCASRIIYCCDTSLIMKTLKCDNLLIACFHTI